MSKAYPVFEALLRNISPEAYAEYQFLRKDRAHAIGMPARLWRFDYAFPDVRLAIEVQGGVWSRGRHSRGAGQVADYEKHNAATQAGWVVLYYTPDQLTKSATLAQIEEIYKRRAKY